MHTQESNDEQSPNQVHSKVMGKSNSVQTDSSSRKPAESLSLTDLQVTSEYQQSEQETSLESLSEAFEKEDINSDQWETMFYAVTQSLDALTSSLAPAITRIEKLEE